MAPGSPCRTGWRSTATSPALLARLAAAPEAPCLRTLTFRWAPGMGRRAGEGRVVNLPEDLLARLTALPVGRHLTHLGSSLALTEGQAAALRTAGVEPLLARDPHGPHTLPPAAFRRSECRWHVVLTPGDHQHPTENEP